MSESEEEKFGLDKPHLRTFLRNVKQEIENMKAGEGKFLKRALHFEKGTSPALNRLKIFEEFPTKKNLDEFVDHAIQDFGKMCGDAFKSWSSLVFQDLTPVEDRKPIEKTFETQIKDIFYDCFKAAHIPLDPNQMDLLERHTRKMANIFQAEIHKGISTEIAALVKHLKDDKDKTTKPDADTAH